MKHKGQILAMLLIAYIFDARQKGKN